MERFRETLSSLPAGRAFTRAAIARAMSKLLRVDAVEYSRQLRATRAIRAGERRGRIVAQSVDVNDPLAIPDEELREWRYAVGAAVDAFSHIELTTREWVVHDPSPDVRSIPSRLTFVQRAERIIVAMQKAKRLSDDARAFLALLKQALTLADRRNLIAHNPVAMRVLTDPDYGDTSIVSGIWNPTDTADSGYDERARGIELADVLFFAQDSERLAQAMRDVVARLKAEESDDSYRDAWQSVQTEDRCHEDLRVVCLHEYAHAVIACRRFNVHGEVKIVRQVGEASNAYSGRFIPSRRIKDLQARRIIGLAGWLAERRAEAEHASDADVAAKAWDERRTAIAFSEKDRGIAGDFTQADIAKCIGLLREHWRAIMEAAELRIATHGNGDCVKDG
jgi:hypothetical protein